MKLGNDSVNGVCIDNARLLAWLTAAVPPESLATRDAFSAWLVANVTPATATPMLISLLLNLFSLPGD